MIRSLPIAIVLVAAAAVVAPLSAQPPGSEAFEEVLDHVAGYVSAYQRDFVGVVAEETYRQQVNDRAGTDVRGFPIDRPTERRSLKSDVLLVRAPAGDRWMQFRDVFELDGKPVRDRAERLTKLFLEPSASAQQQVKDISAASARYNIGTVNRTINLPVLALAVFEPQNRPWFVFSGGRRKATPQGGEWEIEFREERGATLIRTTDDQPMPARGRFVVDGASGRVLSSELVARDDSLQAKIDVTYAHEPSVGMHVPREMREKYVTSSGSVIEGRATYAKFRRYQVRVDEKIAPIK